MIAAASELRRDMVKHQIVARGVGDERVLAAMARVPRDEFVPAEYQDRAYEDTPLPIGLDQTISQPYIVGLMTEQLRLKRTDRVLEIGTGSGYQAAMVAEIAAEVFTVEIHRELAERARATLERLGYANVHVRHDDGYRGWPEEAPFDAAIVTCAASHLSEAVARQLKEGGRVVAPITENHHQTLYCYQKRFNELRPTAVIPVMFVPMTGEAQRGLQLQLWD